MIHLQEIDGRKIACWVNNGGFLPDRRTLVFIHGSGGDHTNWIQQYTPLKDDVQYRGPRSARPRPVRRTGRTGRCPPTSSG